MARSKITCKRCGESELYWMTQDGRYKLYGADGPHMCGHNAPLGVPLETTHTGVGISRAEGVKAGEGKNPMPQPTNQPTMFPNAPMPTQQELEQAIQRFSQQLTSSMQKPEGLTEEEAKALAQATTEMLQVAQTTSEKEGKKLANMREELQQRNKLLAEAEKKKLMDELKSESQKQIQAATAPQKIQIDMPNMTLELDGSNHKQFGQLIKLLLLDTYVFLPGQAGSGKTTAAAQAAEALGRYFKREDYQLKAISVTEMTSESRMSGFFAANGALVSTAFRDAFIDGHLFLLDEVDAGNPNVLSYVNMALSVGFAAFADGVHKKHEHFRCVVAGNTYGNGGNQLYVGRNALDGAFLDRFYFLPWEVDERLEMDVARSYAPDKPEIHGWVKFVQGLRKKHSELGVSAPPIVVSPRASFIGAKLIAAGVHQSMDPELLEAVIWRGAKVEHRKKLGF